LNSDELLRLGRQVIALEARAVARLGELAGPEFAQACHLIMGCAGRVVVTGMGKSGHVGSKIAATLASTGTPAFFVHPGEASHGDLGMIIDGDLVMAISNSGETPEILTILPIIKRLGVKLIALTGNSASTLAAQADVNVDVSVEQEACPLNLAPTASTTATLAMGDAIAVALYQARGFTESDFARSHPGGALGRRLLGPLPYVCAKSPFGLRQYTNNRLPPRRPPLNGGGCMAAVFTLRKQGCFLSAASNGFSGCGGIALPARSHRFCARSNIGGRERGFSVLPGNGDVS